jgi:hypothetical protein
MQMNNILSPVQRSKSGLKAPQFQGWSKATAMRRGEELDQMKPLAINAASYPKYSGMSTAEVLQIVQNIQDEINELDRYNSMPGTHNLHVVLPSESGKIKAWETELNYVAMLAPLPVVDTMDRAIATVQGYTFSEELAKRIESRLYRTVVTRQPV